MKSNAQTFKIFKKSLKHGKIITDNLATQTDKNFIVPQFLLQEGMTCVALNIAKFTAFGIWGKNAIKK